MDEPKPARPAEPTFEWTSAQPNSYSPLTGAGPNTPTPPVVNDRKRVVVPTVIALLLIGGAVVVPNVGTSHSVVPINGAFSNIAIVGGSNDVKIGYADVAQPRLEQQNNSRVNASVADGTLRVEAEHTKWRPFKRDQRLDLVLPLSMQATRPSVTVNGSSGNIELRGDYGNVGVEVASGNAEFKGSWTAAKVRASSGNASIKGVGGPLDAESTSGNLRVETENVDSLRAKASSGNVQIDSINAKSIDASAGSGNVRLDAKGTLPERINSETNSGLVDLDVPDGNYKVNTRVGSGHVKVSVSEDQASPHVIDARAGSGSIKIH